MVTSSTLVFDSAGHYDLPLRSEPYPAPALPCCYLQCGLPERGLPPDARPSRAAAPAHLARRGRLSGHRGPF